MLDEEEVKGVGEGVEILKAQGKQFAVWVSAFRWMS